MSGKWSASRTEKSHNYLEPISNFRKPSPILVDKQIICGNIAKLFQEWQCDVGLFIQPGVREPAES
jgi:hypothetical protein